MSVLELGCSDFAKFVYVLDIYQRFGDGRGNYFMVCKIQYLCLSKPTSSYFGRAFLIEMLSPLLVMRRSSGEKIELELVMGVRSLYPNSGALSSS
jgi:hypothetical protein